MLSACVTVPCHTMPCWVQGGPEVGLASAAGCPEGWTPCQEERFSARPAPRTAWESLVNCCIFNVAKMPPRGSPTGPNHGGPNHGGPNHGGELCENVLNHGGERCVA